jgi:hypothetical protein
MLKGKLAEITVGLFARSIDMMKQADSLVADLVCSYLSRVRMANLQEWNQSGLPEHLGIRSLAACGDVLSESLAGCGPNSLVITVRN